MTISRMMRRASAGQAGAIDYAALVDSLAPTYFWPLQTDLVPSHGAVGLTSAGTAPNFLRAGPPALGGTCADSSAMELRGSFNAANSNLGYSFGGWFAFDKIGAADSPSCTLTNWSGSGGAMMRWSGSATAIQCHHDSDSIFSDSLAWTAGDWHHLFVTWDGSARRMYFDGVDVGGDIPGGGAPNNSGTNFNIGTYTNRSTDRTDGGFAWCGWWEDVALDPADVAALAMVA